MKLNEIKILLLLCTNEQKKSQPANMCKNNGMNVRIKVFWQAVDDYNYGVHITIYVDKNNPKYSK